jgi:LysR family cys regulon transcriptional activator
MNFQQLRIIREAVRRDFNLTEVANALFTSQSGVSKHIKDLEDELGIELFVRRGKRLTGLTEPGKEMVGVVERMLLDALNIKRLAEQFQSRRRTAHLVTTHTRHAMRCPRWWRSSNPPSPDLGASRQGVSHARRQRVSVSPPGARRRPTWFFPVQWHHAIVPRSTAQPSRVTLAELADYPLITYHEGFTGRSRIDRAFADAGLTPDIVMSALDADVIKTYVELGLGVGIVASMAWHPKKDEGLALLDGTNIFPANTTRIAVRRGHYLRGFAYRFIAVRRRSHRNRGARSAGAGQGRTEPRVAAADPPAAARLAPPCRPAGARIRTAGAHQSAHPEGAAPAGTMGLASQATGSRPRQPRLAIMAWRLAILLALFALYPFLLRAGARNARRRDTCRSRFAQTDHPPVQTPQRQGVQE